jgi:PLP dependent protein
MTTVAGRLAAIEARVAAACAKAGRPRSEVELIAVSKLQPPELIAKAYEAGQRDFGENYAQELRDKATGLADLAGLRWHAIGPLQANKGKYVAKVAHAFHALDRLDVASELSKRRTGPALRCYLEVNVAGEATKSGLKPADVEGFLTAVRQLPNLEVIGLMTLPPLSDDPRPHFRALRELAKRLKLSGLSIGTTADFEAAIEEGATAVRVGTAIFGDRPS